MFHAMRDAQWSEVRPVAVARGSNHAGMRAHNERLVLSLIRQSGPMPKVEIARLTGLSPQTVSVIMRALEADGLLRKRDPLRGRVGQPSVPLGLDADGAFFLGLNVGRRSVELVMIDFLGSVRERARLTCADPTPDAVLGFADTAITTVLGRLPEALRGRVAGLGIALPFRLWDWPDRAGNAAAPTPWRDRDIARELAASHDFPVYLCNDASAACGAELVFGPQDRPRDFLYVYIGYFAGGGLVLGNALYTGSGGNAGALGSMPVTTAAGQRCQLVDVASLARLEAMVTAAGHAWPDAADWTGDRTCDRDLPPEPVDQWTDAASDGLAQAIMSASCVIDVRTVLIDGRMPATIRADLVARAQDRLRRTALPGVDLPTVRQGTIGRDARTIGAASLPLSNRFLADRTAHSYRKADP